MHLYRDGNEVIESLNGIVARDDTSVTVINGKRLTEELIDTLVYNSLFNNSGSVTRLCSWLIHAIALYMHTEPSSLHRYYRAHARRDFQKRSLPIFFLPLLTYDAARALFRAARQTHTIAFAIAFDINQLERLEMTPSQCASCILAAAIKESYHAPVFLMAEGLQMDPEGFARSSTEERNRLRRSLGDLVNAGYYNFQIDASLLQKRGHNNIGERLHANVEQSVAMTLAVREYQPANLEFALSATVRPTNDDRDAVDPVELQTFLDDYSAQLRREAPNLFGLDTVLVDIGTKRGGTIMPDGRVTSAGFDESVVEQLSDIAIQQHKLGGICVVGASAFDDQQLRKIVDCQAVALQFESLAHTHILESRHFPSDIVDKMKVYLADIHRQEHESMFSQEQFFRTYAPYAFGGFKKALWNIDPTVKEALVDDLQPHFVHIFRELRVTETRNLIRETIKAIQIAPKKPTDID